MNQLQKSGGKPSPSPIPAPVPMPQDVEIALQAFQNALDTAVAIAAKREDSRTDTYPCEKRD